jgi:chromosome segregation ATPase
MKEKINKLKILNDSKDNELKYVKKKYENLSRRYSSLEWKYNELLLNTHYHRDYTKKLETKYNYLMAKQRGAAATGNMCLIDIHGDILSVNDDYEHI